MIEIDWKLSGGDILSAAISLVGLLGIFLAAIQLRVSRRAQQTQLLLSIQDRFRAIPDFTDFLYRLDYAGDSAWVFDPKAFPHSRDERVLDAILYELAFVGSLVEAKDIHPRDLKWLKSWIAIVLRNSNVVSYLRWLKSPGQLPDHDAFASAISLYLHVMGKDAGYDRLKPYLMAP